MKRVLTFLILCLAFTLKVFAAEAEIGLLSWSPLKSWDKVHVVAPGYGAEDGSIEKARENLLKYGLLPQTPGDIINRDCLGYSNTEEYRANHLKRLMKCPDARVIWALRGGQGCSSLLPYLQDIPKDTSPRLFVGYGNVTALHLWASKRGWPSLHGSFLEYNQDEDLAVNSQTSLKEIISILRGETTEVSYKLTPLNSEARKNLIVKGSVVGGNLSSIQQSIGTDTQLNTKGRIVLLEDTAMPTHMYETLTHLDRAGLFDSCKGIIWGNFCASKEELTRYKIITNIFCEKMAARGIPVIHSEEFGHGPKNKPLPFNTPAILHLGSDEVTLTVKTNNAT